MQEAEGFKEYARDLSEYLQTLEQRLFSEGLHTLGHVPTAAETQQYLAAYFGDDLPAEVSLKKCVTVTPCQHVMPCQYSGIDRDQGLLLPE